MNIPSDKGARFQKCDFQIHTLRDAAWSGPFTHMVNDRPAFAEALVEDCRRKGLNAIAITDHHDMCMWKSVRDAAQAEKDAAGNIIPEQERLVVFPGIELTLATPSCQAIIILDPNLPEAILGNIWGALRLTPTPDTNAKTTQTTALHTDLTLEEITRALSAIRTNPEETNPGNFSYLDRRFILLPNVKKNGHKNILRDGFQAHFISMPCVGGYIEGCFYSDLERLNREIVEGKIQAWGSKRLGIFQTSDCRAATKPQGGTTIDFTNLGAWPTWVKWAEPSAEALRQACLARRSRISHIEPTYPLFQIVGVIVSDSKFLGPVELGLNPQFNAFIGGRGTGKSSLLEYIRWALCDDPQSTVEASELPDFQKRRKVLVTDTLKPLNAKVTVFYKKNEVVYRIERTITDKSDSVVVIEPDGKTQSMSSEQVRREFPIVSYAQKQLSCVGTLPEEINRLITDPIKEQRAQVQDRIEKTILPQLRQQRQRELQLKTLTAQLAELTVTIKSKKEQVQALQSQLQSLTPEQQLVVQAHDILSQQDQTINRAIDLPVKIAALLEQCRKQMLALGSVTPVKELPNINQVDQLAASANAFAKKCMDVASELATAGSAEAWMSGDDKNIIAELRKLFTDHSAEYDRCVQDSAKNAKQLEEIKSLNRQVTELEGKQAALESERSTLKVIFDEIGLTHWDALIAALKERADMLHNQCEIVANQAQHEFKPELAFCGNKRPVLEAAERLILGRNVKDSDQKLTELATIVCLSMNPAIQWSAFMLELEQLFDSKDSGVTPPTPILQSSGFTSANIESIRLGLKRELLEEIRFLNFEDQIVFRFRLGTRTGTNGNYIPFEQASPGQQATCLLRTLLAQEGAPLIIDQPEEDLDNEQVHVLAERISETKHNRQLIFISHNANIVVNGDAELVVCFGYQDAADNTRGKIHPIGSIDCAPVRNSITTVMEGGRQAFELRQKKYGF